MTFAVRIPVGHSYGWMWKTKYGRWCVSAMHPDDMHPEERNLLED